MIWNWITKNQIRIKESLAWSSTCSCHHYWCLMSATFDLAFWTFKWSHASAPYLNSFLIPVLRPVKLVINEMIGICLHLIISQDCNFEQFSFLLMLFDSVITGNSRGHNMNNWRRFFNFKTSNKTWLWIVVHSWGLILICQKMKMKMKFEQRRHIMLLELVHITMYYWDELRWSTKCL